LRAATVHQWWGYVESLNNIIAFEGRSGAPFHACTDADELSEMVLIIGSAARPRRVVGELNLR
jgi:hypothetical protein